MHRVTILTKISFAHNNSHSIAISMVSFMYSIQTNQFNSEIFSPKPEKNHPRDFTILKVSPQLVIEISEK